MAETLRFAGLLARLALRSPSFMSAWGLGGAFNKLPSTRLNSGSLVGSVLAMDIFLLRVFQSQVALQCQFLLAAANEVNVALKERNTERTFYALQNLLNAGANISKALWGAGGKFADQRKPLRDSIGIDDSSPLREVTMRNNFEHFDERLDRWWKESKHHNHMDLIIGPAATTIVGHEETDKFRHFDPTTCNMVFWGQEFNLQTIVTEVQKILPKLQAEANKPNWETTPATPKV